MSVFDNIYNSKQPSFVVNELIIDPLSPLETPSIVDDQLSSSAANPYHAPTDCVTPFSFYQLPRELRDHVYTLAFDEVYRGRCAENPNIGDLIIKKGQLQIHKLKTHHRHYLSSWLLLNRTTTQEALRIFHKLLSFRATFFFQSRYRVFDYPMFVGLDIRSDEDCISRVCQFTTFKKLLATSPILGRLKSLNIDLEIGAVCFDKWERNRYFLTYRMLKDLEIVMDGLRDCVQDEKLLLLKNVYIAVTVRGVTVSARDLDGVITAFGPLSSLLCSNVLNTQVEWLHPVAEDERDLSMELFAYFIAKQRTLAQEIELLAGSEFDQLRKEVECTQLTAENRLLQRREILQRRKSATC